MTIPAIPIAGTADGSPLVTVEQYTQVTGDSQFTNQSDFDPYLADAADLFQRRTRRTLLYAQYNERLFLYKNGQVYPSATPFDTTKPVGSPTGSPPENVGIFQGNGIWAGWYIPLPSLPIWTGVVSPQTDITYWGGYVGPGSALATSDPQRLLPASIRRILCRIAWFCLHPVTMAGQPGGAQSVSVAGVSVSSAAGDLDSMVDSDSRLRKDIKRWRHPQARQWDAQITS